MTGLTETGFAWTVTGLGIAALAGLVWLGGRRHTDEPEAEERAVGFVLGDQPDYDDDADEPDLAEVDPADLRRAEIAQLDREPCTDPNDELDPDPRRDLTRASTAWADHLGITPRTGQPWPPVDGDFGMARPANGSEL